MSEERYALNKQLAQMLKGGVSRMSDPKMIKGIREAVSIPVMAKCRIGHFVEAQILEAIGIAFHPELDADDRIHAMFLGMCGKGA